MREAAGVALSTESMEEVLADRSVVALPRLLAVLLHEQLRFCCVQRSNQLLLPPLLQQRQGGGGQAGRRAGASPSWPLR